MLCKQDHPAIEQPSATAREAMGYPEPDPLQGLLLETLLEEQQSLRTPVALFAEAYEARTPAKRFSHLLPLSRPQQGEQYAFEVNLDACTGCKACVAACHSLNGLDETEAWRDMGLLVGTRKQPYLQTVTTACHHCLEPACAEGCPVLAYDKDPITGIVRHLDDQCIGCSYCILKCPYDVPKFNLKRGIVRKCDMCHGRLAEGEAPACVQACPNEAIKIVTVKVPSVPRSGSIISGAFDSAYTGPTTRYISKHPVPEHAQAADAGRLLKDHAHAPLAWMLVMTQMSAGAFVVTALGFALHEITTQQAYWISLIAWLIGVLGIHLSVLHLGQPLKAWRAFLGWRTSWLSREILAFGAFAVTGSMILPVGFLDVTFLLGPVLTLSAVWGMVAVFTSIMVYVDTRRAFWSLPRVSEKFVSTMLILGAGLVAAVSAVMEGIHTGSFFLIALGCQWIQFVSETKRLEAAQVEPDHPWHASARVLVELHAAPLLARRHLFAITAFLMPLFLLCGFPQLVLIPLWVFLALASQLIERGYFFTACAGPKMPGN